MNSLKKVVPMKREEKNMVSDSSHLGTSLECNLKRSSNLIGGRTRHGLQEIEGRGRRRRRHSLWQHHRKNGRTTSGRRRSYTKAKDTKIASDVNSSEKAPQNLLT